MLIVSGRHVRSLSPA